MAEQYREQYKKEMEQIHAPAELIARTKAAVREEEARMRKDSAAQAAGMEIRGSEMVSGSVAAPAGGRSNAKSFSVRRWAYPLTAVAALLILVSVSLTMRGLKSGNMASGSASSEEMAVETESAAISEEEGADGGMAAGAAVDVEETVEEALPDEAASAEAPTSVTEAEKVPELGAAVENAASDEAARSKGAEDILADDTGWEKADGVSGETEAKQEAVLVPAENITIEEVVKKPDFYGRSDTETHVFEGETFYVVGDGNGWAAYVETKEGGMYVIRGEAEDVETFLEAGYRELYSHAK